MKLLVYLRMGAALIALPLAMSASLLSAAADAPKRTAEQIMADYEAAAAKADAVLNGSVIPNSYFRQGDAAYAAKKYTEAYALFEKGSVSDTGIVAALSHSYLGQMLELGRGVEYNKAEAIKHYKLAAAGGLTRYYQKIGDMYYYDGFGDADADAAKALIAYLAIPDLTTDDKIDAQYKMGKIYIRESGVPKDYKQAYLFFMLANAGVGHNDAGYELGMMSLKGNGIAQNFASAADFLKKAAVDNMATKQSGIPEAQYVLSTLYAAGKGVVQSDSEAVKYLRMAAHQDHTRAQFGLGMMYAAGKGVPQSGPIGYLWIARAAEGNATYQSYSAEEKAVFAESFGTASAIKARDAIRVREGWNAEELAKVKVIVDRCVANSDACNWGE